MKRVVALILAGLVCFLAIPSVAQARYADGMNHYEYVGSQPTDCTDPMGQQKIKGANEYGDWDITQTNHDAARAGGQYSSSVTIKFIPNKDKVCCDEIVFIQMARFIDSNGSMVATPDRRRATRSGWSIDRVNNRKSPYYGYDNSGRPSALITPGSSPTPYGEATLRDTPGANAPNVKWQFETVATCKKGRDADHPPHMEANVYGALTWGFDVDGAGKLTSHSPIATNLESYSFMDAVDAWNKQAMGPDALKNDPDQEKIKIYPFPVRRRY